jgi:hypothetical protein
MATGGIFTLITNDGRQDRMLMATALLNQRLDLIRKARRADNLADETPSLVDIEKTHILFTNAHFKPFAAIGYEYNKVNLSGGAPSLGSDVQFSIPQFGDFFHDMVLHIKLKQPTLTITGGTAPSDEPGMRWCAYPGERICKKTQFEVNGNPLDEYKSDVYNFYREFQVSPNKRVGWDRCTGQEIAEAGFVDQPHWAGSGVGSAAVTHRVKSDVCSGPQTVTGQKDQTEAGDLELFVPLLFWCNKDPRLSVPSVAIPYGQRFINVSLATQQELVNYYPRGNGTWASPNGSVDTGVNLIRTMELYINNIFVNPEVHDIFIQRIGFTMIRVHRHQTAELQNASGEIHLQQLKWPIETLFVGVRMAEYVSTSPALQAEHMDKWHKFSQITQTSRAAAGWESSRLGALSGTNLAVTAATGAVVGTGTDFDGSVSGGAAEVAVGDFLVMNGAPHRVVSVADATNLVVVFNGIVADDAAVTDFSVVRKQAQTSTVDVCARTVDSITIKAHGIPIYNNFPSGFYNAYLPLHYGGSNVNTPDDCGAMMVNFCLYPGTYQPSGHLNISRAREFYLEYTSSLISGNDLGRLVVIASAINFLLISDGSAVLRYST